MNATYYIDKLKLESHPEGGFYKETYRDKNAIGIGADTSFPNGRNYSTAIYFLLRTEEFSAFHRIKSDELWHFYTGKSLSIYCITPGGKLEIIKLGPDIENGEVFQAVVPAGYWFASRLEKNEPGTYALVGCTVAPGFDFKDFEMAGRQQLFNEFPQHMEMITELTHP